MLQKWWRRFSTDPRWDFWTGVCVGIGFSSIIWLLCIGALLRMCSA